MRDSDDSLVRSAQRGNRSAFEEMVRRTSRLVYARLYLETGDTHQSEDLVQETYLQAFRALKSLESASQFRAWLCTIADNVLIDSARRDGRQKRAAPPRSPAETLGQVAGKTPSPPEEAQLAERRQHVLSVVRSLPEDYRLPVMLRYFAGADYESMEMQLGLTNGALRGMLHRGLKMLKDKLEEVNL